MMLALVIVAVLRGRGGPSIIGVRRCMFADWALLGLLGVVAIVITLIAAKIMVGEYQEKVSAGYQFVEGDMQATPANVSKLVIIALSCGMISGAFGVSPGLLLNPIMLALGLNTVVGVSTVMYVVLFTTLATTFLSIFEDLLNPQYGTIVVIMTIIGTYPGILYQNYIIEVYKRNSIVVVLFGIAMLFCMVTLPMLQLQTILNEGTDTLFALSDYCN